MITGLRMNPAALIAAGLAVTRVAEAGGYTYVGHALGDDPSEGAAVWMIRRIDENGSSAFADGVRDFCRRWDLRATYTYAV
ncbi:MAG: hypothetical protein BWZ02_02083 [Lentisphaerae bacterium ADurb.BinA184]|nr:MAG: hypothetical protein BWZ02_02083 [Lentisphaerae bacterium ADurb.BinA184]